MKIPWKIIILAMMLLTTSGCSWLLAPPPLELPVIAFSDLCQQSSTIFCQDFNELPPNSSELIEGIFLNGESCAKAENNPQRGCPKIEAGTLKFTVPSHSGAGSEGQYYIRFSDFLDGQPIGPGQEVFIQWKQRFSATFLNTQFDPGDGWKQAMVGAADEYSCSSNEIVMVNYKQLGFPQMYHACGYSWGFETRVWADYVPDEWMTFQIGLTHGQPGENSRIRLWVSREGQHSTLAIDHQGGLINNKGYGKMWFLPYQTGKNTAKAHPEGYIWYDQLIISRTQLPDR